MKQNIIIVDFGSQVTKLIARRIRDFGVFSQIIPFDRIEKKLFTETTLGIILSGGPKSVTTRDAPKIPNFIYDLEIPILGICYGLQLICKDFGGKVSFSKFREFGKTKIKIKKFSLLTDNIYLKNEKYNVWMSHSDKVENLPKNFEIVASSKDCNASIIQNVKRKIYGVQFHPEVVHTFKGDQLLKNFIFKICNCKKLWNMSNFKNEIIEQIRIKVQNDKVLCGLSGGVDSTVTAVLVNHALGKKLQCVFVDTGLMRKNEAEEIKKLFEEHFDIPLKIIKSSKIFFQKLKGVRNPEGKRKIIGKLFVKIFENYSNKNSNFKFLAQGTLYPDVIESSSQVGKGSVTIKSHHNVGGLPKRFNFKLLEPLRELFKDEVRDLGKKLKIPKNFLERHPFPGPGLAVRILGEVNAENVRILQEADDIFINLIKTHGLYKKIWQAFCVLLPNKTVGVMGDDRTYEKICVIRAVTSVDGMTAEAYKFSHEFLEICSNEIINKVAGINRVCYDLTSKPPGTIEFE